MTRYYSAIAVDNTLASAITSSSTSAILNVSPVGYPSSFPFVLAFDYNTSTEELILVTAISGTTLTISRGFNGTSPQSHAVGAVIRHVITAQDLTDAQNHYAATTAVHGVTGNVVGDSDTQTLINKTIDYNSNTLLNLPGANFNLSFNAQTNTTYTLISTDANKLVTFNNASAITLTVPSSVFTTGQQVNIQQIGAGQVSIVAGSGVTITSTGATIAAPNLRAQYSAATIICTGTNTFTVIGDIS